MALIPPPLAPGATLAVVSPAGPAPPGEVERGSAALRELGYRLHPMPSAHASGGYLAGPDAGRAADLMDAFLDAEIDGILCTRGGYGSMRLLPLLDYDRIAAHPKPLVGFSDITALQTALWRRCGLVTFSGPQLAKGWGKGLDAFSRAAWSEMLAGKLWGRPLPLPGDLRALEVVRPGVAEGRLLGGNLALLAALAGTGFAPDFTGAILLLEEIDEPLYRIDRMLTQLALAGLLEGVRGVVLGRFRQHTADEVREWSRPAAELLADYLPDVPILLGAPYGHEGECWTLPLGARALLDGKDGTLTVEAE